MSDKNHKVSAILSKTADMLELDGANGYRIKAYRQAAQRIASLDRDVQQLLTEKNDVFSTIGISKQIGDKVKQIMQTNNLPELNELKKRLPTIFSQLLDVPCLGAHHVAKLYLELNVKSLADLKKALENNTLQKRADFDDTLIEQLKTSLQ